MAGKVWLITGASTGFGRSLVNALIARAFPVAATARKIEALAAWAGCDDVLAAALDVTAPATVEAAVDATLKRFGRIDVLVNNAGFGMIGAIEEVSDAEVRRVFDTNVFGLLAVTRAVLPHMRAQGAGTVVNIGSVGGLNGNPGSGIYAATKFALEGIGDSLAAEVAPLGIKVLTVEPGPFRTDFAGRSLGLAERVIDAYANTAGKRRTEQRDRSGRQPGDPDKAAALIIDLVEAGNAPARLVLGDAAIEGARKKLRGVLADIDRMEALSRATSFDTP